MYNFSFYSLSISLIISYISLAFDLLAYSFKFNTLNVITLLPNVNSIISPIFNFKPGLASLLFTKTRSALAKS